MAKTISILPAATTSKHATCDPCLRGKTTLDCDGYCTDCHENLCHECIEHHRKLRVTMEHKILKAGKLIPLLQKDVTNVTLPNCSLHSRNELCSYCEDHNKLCCSVCQSVDHRQCKSVIKLEDHATKAKVQEVSSNLKSKLEETRDSYIKTVKMQDTAMKNLEKQKTDALKTISENCSIMFDLIDKLKKKTEKNVMSSFARAKELLESTVKDCKERSTSLEKHLQNLENKEKQMNDVNAFIDIKLIEQDFKRTENETDSFRKTQIPEIEFNANDSIIEALKTVNSLMECSVFGEHKLQEAVKVKKEKDKAKFSGSISDMAIHRDGTVVTCDYHHSQLVVLDSKLNYITHLQMPFAPTGVCINDKSNNAVVAHKAKFTVVTLKPCIGIKNTINTTSTINYNGISSQGDEIYTLHSKGPTVSVYSLDGKKSRQSGVLVPSPAGIAVSCDGSWSAVSSFNENLVALLDRELHVTRKIENLPHLDEPFALETDDKDRLYVSIKNNVLILHPDSKAIKLDDNNSLDGWPIVKYNKTRGRLFLVVKPWENVAIWQP